MEDRLRKEIKKELEYSNKKLEEMEKLVKSLAQRKPKVYILMYYYTEDCIYNNEGCVCGIYSTYEKAKDVLQERLEEYVEYKEEEHEGIYEAKDEKGFYNYYTIVSEEVN